MMEHPRPLYTTTHSLLTEALWYMRDLEARGFSRSAIVQEMKKRGFSKEDIERFSKFKNLPPPKT
jgi:hypothetical protein